MRVRRGRQTSTFSMINLCFRALHGGTIRRMSSQTGMYLRGYWRDLPSNIVGKGNRSGHCMQRQLLEFGFLCSAPASFLYRDVHGTRTAPSGVLCQALSAKVLNQLFVARCSCGLQGVSSQRGEHEKRKQNCRLRNRELSLAKVCA